MDRSPLRDRVLAGEVTYGAFAMTGSPLATQLLGRAGFDWLVVDLEHGEATEADLVVNLLAAGSTGTSAIV
ncbi:MAG TPA: hypothetical protein VH813_03090, partial [Candidatus Limnocylindrales bacterium]